MEFTKTLTSFRRAMVTSIRVIIVEEDVREVRTFDEDVAIVVVPSVVHTQFLEYERSLLCLLVN